MFVAVLFVVITLPIGKRLLVHGFTPGFFEYTSVFFYISDIALLLLIGVFFFDKQRRVLLFTKKNLFFFIFLLVAIISIFLSDHQLLSAFQVFRLTLWIVFALSLSTFWNTKQFLKPVFMAFAVMAVFESLLALLQFISQENLGLSILGEQPIAITDPGTSRVWLNGSWAIRAYGTFLHPNVLSAFLLLGLFSLYYFWVLRTCPSLHVTRENYKEKFREYRPMLISSIILGIAIFVVLMGLALTFSRAGWAIGFVLSLLVISYWLLVRPYRREAFKLLIVLVTCSLFLVTMLRPFIFPRAQISGGEPAVTERIKYANIGLEIIKKNPFGVGIGNQVLYAHKNQLFQNQGFIHSQKWQPVHNIYLLIAAELGVFGLLAFIALLISFIKPIIKKLNLLEVQIPILMLSVLLLFGLTDHFIWTLYQGQLMFWVVIGMVLGIALETSNK